MEAARDVAGPPEGGLRRLRPATPFDAVDGPAPGKRRIIHMTTIAARGAARFALAAIASLGLAGSAAAFPEKDVTLTVGFGPGGPSDIAARFMQRHFEEVTGNELVILNKPGAGGAVAWSQINNDPADGYHLTLLNFPHTVLQPIVRGANAGYTYDDVQPVMYYAAVPHVLAVRADSPIETFEDFMAAAKDDPGSVTVGGVGVGGSNHAVSHLFNDLAGIETAYVPFKDTASNVAALKGGVVDAAWTFTTQGVKDGDAIRLLAIATDERFPIFPDVPTLTELGYDLVDMAYWAVGVPPSVPEEMRPEIAAAFVEVLKNEAVAEEMADAGYLLQITGYDDVNGLRQELYDTYAPLGPALTN
jgi:tripartite-type tricarboxylate transporter receptor subunit TctC